MKDLLRQNDFEAATRLGNHYLSFLDSTARAPELEELARIPELFTAMATARTDFWSAAGVRLADALQRGTLKEFQHRQIVNCLMALSRTVAVYEDFPLIQAVGAALERQVTQDSARHRECCAAALPELLKPAAVGG